MACISCFCFNGLMIWASYVFIKKSTSKQGGVFIFSIIIFFVDYVAFLLAYKLHDSLPLEEEKAQPNDSKAKKD